LVPKLRSSAYFATVVPSLDGFDVQFAVELGAAIMLDMPIIALVRPGVQVPERLVRVAEAVLEFDPDDIAGNADRLSEVMERLTRGLPALPSPDATE
jgi:hypothetical protein